MSRGFQPDPIKEYAALSELAEAMRQWQMAERAAVRLVRKRIAEGVRSNVIAEHLGWSKTTLYRWLAAHPTPEPAKRPAQPRKKQSRNRAA